MSEDEPAKKDDKDADFEPKSLEEQQKKEAAPESKKDKEQA